MPTRPAGQCVEDAFRAWMGLPERLHQGWPACACHMSSATQEAHMGYLSC